MPATKDLGRAFFHWIYLSKDAPIIHSAPTQELDAPFRNSPRSVVIRLWPYRYGFVLGWWHRSGFSESEALRRGIGARVEAVLDDSGHLLDQFEIWDV